MAPTSPRLPLTVVYRPVGSLMPDPRNARTHPKRQLEQIAASIREFGFTNPILIDPEGGDHRRARPAAGGEGDRHGRGADDRARRL